MILREFQGDAPIFGGCDLASTTDLTAWAMIQHQPDTQGWICNWHFWLPDERVQTLERRDAVPYRQWEEAGLMTFTPGKRIDHRWVKDKIVEDCMEHDIGEVGFDPFNAEWLQSAVDIEGINAISVPQSFMKLSEPSHRFEASVAEGTFKHGRNPIARWMVENIEVDRDNSNHIRPVKPLHGSGKRIDGIVAVILALAVAIVSDNDGTSPYDTPGALSL